MARPRVNEVARELGVGSKDVLAFLEEIGRPAKSHSSAVDDDVLEPIRKHFSGDGAEPVAPAPSSAPQKAPARAAETVPPAPVEVSEPDAPPPVETAPVETVAAADAPSTADAPSPPALLEGTAGTDEGAIKVHRGITVQDLAAKIDRSAGEIVKTLLGLGEMVTVTQSLGDDAVLLVAEELGVDVRVVDPGEEEASVAATRSQEDLDDPSLLVPRPPVVTVMGHVDHGKTSILDAIRRANVVSGEAGGITQAIGAYQVAVGDRRITFIDTPGHEAFTAMRARGAQVTDLAILVVAADDGVKPQTIEAIDHARAAGVPIVVAVNKIDKPEADPARVRQQLSDRGLLPEEWGGDTIYVDVSAKARTNLDGLLEMLLLTADVQLDLRSNPSADASGWVIEAHLDKGRGPIATVLVRRGTLRKGDALVAGPAWARVRAMQDERGTQVASAGPGQPVQVLGWQSLPEAGDEFHAVVDERDAKRIAQEREQHRRAAELVSQHRVASLETLLRVAETGEVPALNLILKADTQGGAEALDDQLAKMDQSLVKIDVIRKGVGAITENDITLAQASRAIVIGFNVVPNAQARTLADEEGVDIRTYRVIYQAVQEIENAARGLLGPLTREASLGQAEVRATFRVPRLGVVAGCMITDGVIRRNARARLVRDGTVIYETTVASLRRFKEDVREVAQGYECGIGLEGFQDIKEGDLIQAFEVQEVER